MSMDQDLLQDFLTEAGDLLDDVDQKLVELEQSPDDKNLLNTIFRGFHTIKGGAGFLDATALVNLCHRTENLFDLLRGFKIELTPELMDVIMASTGEVRRMFGELAQVMAPTAAPDALLESLDYCIEHGHPPREAGELAPADPAVAAAPQALALPQVVASAGLPVGALPVHPRPGMIGADGELDWAAMHGVLTGQVVVVAHGNEDHCTPAAPTDSAAMNLALTDAADSAVAAAIRQTVGSAVPTERKPAAPKRPAPANAEGRAGGGAPQIKDHTIRVDTQRFDQILNLSGEVGLTKNRLNCLRASLLRGGNDDKDSETRKQLDTVLGQLDMLVSDLQTAVMKARMQPVGRVFQKYGRLARDVARSLGKDVELTITGAETEVDKTILEELNDPLVHLVRNAVDHGIETPVERIASGKPAKGTIEISARQAGDHIVIEIRDDGKGMRPEVIRNKAIEKGVISAEDAHALDNREVLSLIFLPGFSTKDVISDVSGRGVGMDVVRTNIDKLKGRIEIDSTPGEGSRFTISLPLTLAILPVLMMTCCEQIYSVPLSAVREIIPIQTDKIQFVNGKPTMVIRGEVLPVLDLATLLGRGRETPAEIGVIAVSRGKGFVLAVDGLVGQDEVMIKPLEGVKPKGVSGATLSGEGVLVLVLELYELLEGHL